MCGNGRALVVQYMIECALMMEISPFTADPFHFKLCLVFVAIYIGKVQSHNASNHPSNTLFVYEMNSYISPSSIYIATQTHSSDGAV